MKIKPFEKKIWLSSPTMHGDEQNFVKEAFDTNWVSTVGPHLAELEKTAASYVGMPYGVALSSGTAALHLAVKLAGIKPGEKVLIADDFLASGAASLGLINICKKAGCEVVGVTALIEKTFQGGRKKIEDMGIKVVSGACIKAFENNTPIFG